jgi:hypothetical protein
MILIAELSPLIPLVRRRRSKELLSIQHPPVIGDLILFYCAGEGLLNLRSPLVNAFGNFENHESVVLCCHMQEKQSMVL